MSKNKNKGVPRSRSKYHKSRPKPSVEFNMGKRVFNYMVAKRLMDYFVTAKHPIYIHFGGILQAYDEWFEALGVDQDAFDEVQCRIDTANVADEVGRLIPIFEEQWKKQLNKDPKIILPSHNVDEAKALIDDFRKVLRGKEG